jgi:hypothetical protein
MCREDRIETERHQHDDESSPAEQEKELLRLAGVLADYVYQ